MAIDGVVMECASERMAAFEVQQRFLQHWGPTIDTLDYSARCRQMGEVGGDFYDFVTLPGGRLAMAIGDASGKGFAAALMISMFNPLCARQLCLPETTAPWRSRP